ncbi:MAG: hypothetical protein ACYTF8_16515, partial [Planctomycetota bacterium]
MAELVDRDAFHADGVIGRKTVAEDRDQCRVLHAARRAAAGRRVDNRQHVVRVLAEPDAVAGERGPGRPPEAVGDAAVVALVEKAD